MEESNKIVDINVPLVLFGLSVSSCLVPLDISIANVSISYITGSFGVDPPSGKSIVTSYFIGEAIGLPLTGWLVKTYGDIKTFLYSMILFGIFSLLCGHSFFLQMLVFSRFFQGIASAPLIPLSQSILFRCLPKEKVTMGVGLMSIFFVLSIILAPLLGGWITTNWGWSWIFNINPPIVLLSGLMIWTQLRGKDLPISKPPLDLSGFLLVVFGVGAWQILIDHGQVWDWWNSDKIRILFFISLAIVIALGFVEWGKTNRFIEFSYFKRRNYIVANIIMWVAIVVDLSTLILLPLWLQGYKEYNAMWAGLVLAPHGIGGLVAGALNGTLIHRFGLFGTSAIGMGLIAISCFYQSHILTPDIDFFHLVIPRIVLGGGIIINYIVLTLACKEEFDVEHQPSAIALFQFSRSIVAATGISLMIVLWERRSSFYHSILVDPVSQINPNATHLLNHLQNSGFSYAGAVEKINHLVSFQAVTLSLNDCYYLMGWLCMGMIFVSFFSKKTTHNSSNQGRGLCLE